MQRLLIVVALVGNGCSCSQNNEHMGTNDLAGNFDLSNQEVLADLAMNPDALAGGDLVVTPDQITLDIYPGMAAPTQAYTAKVRQSGMDVTTMATFTLDDASLGAFSGNTLTANMKAGTTLVHASWQGLTGYTTVHFKLHATNSDNCPGCPAFPPDTTPACSAMTSTPTILYPPNGILVPPNMNVMSTQFDQGMGNTLFEIDYQNAITDMRVLTKCAPITDSKKSATNGCIYELSQDVWDFSPTTTAAAIRSTSSSAQPTRAAAASPLRRA